MATLHVIIQGDTAGSVAGLDSVLASRTGGGVAICTMSEADATTLLGGIAAVFASRWAPGHTPSLAELLQAAVEAWTSDMTAKVHALQQQAAASAAAAAVAPLSVTVATA